MTHLTPPTPVAYVAPEEIAERLGLSLPTVYEMVRKREIPGVLRAARPMRVSRAVFDGWVNGRST